MSPLWPSQVGSPVEVGVMDGYTVALTAERFGGLTSFWWHAWDASGGYAGQANDPRWLALLIARHADR